MLLEVLHELVHVLINILHNVLNLPLHWIVRFALAQAHIDHTSHLATIGANRFGRLLMLKGG